MSLTVTQEGRLRRIVWNDAATRNRLTRETAEALLREFEAASEDAETGAILLESEGPMFSSGLGDQVPDAMFGFGSALKKPLVVSMQGVAISGGVALLANAHIVMAAQGSSFVLTENRGQTSGDLSAMDCDARVLAAVAAALGERRTRELALTGRIFTTPEALAWGLVHAAAPAFELEDRAFSVASALAGANPETTRVILASYARR